MNVGEEALKAYVKHLHEEAVIDIENLTVWECAEQFFGHDLEEDEFQQVFKLLETANVEVEVTWNA